MCFGCVCSVQAIGGFLWLLGGETRQGPSKQLYIFNSQTKIWQDTQADKMGSAPKAGLVAHSMTKVPCCCTCRELCLMPHVQSSWHRLQETKDT
jgi:hypothetical protein